MDLDQFFDAAVPVMRGIVPVESSELTTGPDRVEPSALGRYPRLVHAQHVRAMNAMFRGLEQMTRAEHPGKYLQWVNTYLSLHPSSHRHPSYRGQHFAAFLAGSDAPPWAAEVADLRFTEFLVASAEGARCEVRRYLYDVAAHRTCAPGPGPVDVLVYRDPVSLRARAHYATLAELAAIAQERGELPVDWLSRAQLKPSDLEAGRKSVLRLTGGDAQAVARSGAEDFAASDPMGGLRK